MTLATNGAAAIERETTEALVPIVVPRIKRATGIKMIIKIKNGKDLSMLTILERISFNTGFGIIPP